MNNVNSLSKEIDSLTESTPRYSIATLVTDLEQYQAMLQSFLNAGFKQDYCEYLYIDNTKHNKYDAYQGLNALLQKARGQYVILCHQDILLNFDNSDNLAQCIQQMDQVDPHWAVLGNGGGGSNLATTFICVTHANGELRRKGQLPARVSSLDENFLVVKKSANLGFSRDLSGFHFYGTDLCLQAQSLGWHCYVIAFHLTHLGKATTGPTFYACRQALITKYGKNFHSRFIKTTCSRLFLTNQRWKAKLINTDLMLWLVKQFHKLSRKC